MGHTQIIESAVDEARARVFKAHNRDVIDNTVPGGECLSNGSWYCNP